MLGLVAFAQTAQGFEGCGELHNHYGPFDYRTDKDKLGVVEAYHFTMEVETLRAGKSSYVGGDIDYTLRAFPNHPRALLAMVRLGEKEGTERVRGAQYSVPCYLDRAIRFRPDDPMARMIFGIYLAKHKKNAEALAQLKIAEQAKGDDANLQYNLGLVYLNLGQFDDALRHAQLAYRMGFSLPGLKARLQKAGKWRDPEPVVADDANSAPADESGKTAPIVEPESSPKAPSVTDR
jgi:tetratricopeptide (TPR) repeat protein